MALRILAALAVWIAVAACGLAAELLALRMVDEVNQQLPPEERFAPIGWWYPGKRQRFYTEYDRRFPGSRRRRQLRYLQALACALLIAGLVLATSLGWFLMVGRLTRV